MYTPSPYERPVRPRLAALVAGAAFAATLTGAWGLRQMRFAPVPLGPAVELPGWPFAFQPPLGFKLVGDLPDEPPKDPWRADVRYQKRDARGRGIELIFGFRTYDPNCLSRRAAVQYLLDLTRLEGDVQSETAPQPLAGLYGEAVEVVVPSRRSPLFCRAAAACLPTGQTFGVVLRGVGHPTAADLNAFRSVCGGMRPNRALFADDLRGVTERTGLACDPPADARILNQAGQPAAWISMTASAAASFGWHIEVFPTFLAAGRGVESLMHDHLVNDEITPRPAARVGVTQRDGRAVARTMLASGDVIRDVRFIDLGEGRAAYLIGRAQPNNESALAGLCDQLVGTLRAGAAGWPFHVEQASRQAAKLLDRVARSGIAAMVQDALKPIRWVTEHAGKAVNYDRLEWSPRAGPNARWSGQRHLQRVDARGQLEGLVRRWTIDDAGRACQSNENVAIRRDGRQIKITTDIRRAGESEPILYDVTFDAEAYHAQFEPTDNFLPDPIAEEVIGRFAREPAEAGALFMEATLSDKSLAGVYVRAASTTGGSKDESAAVVEVRDYEPYPMLNWFDAKGRLSRKEVIYSVRVRRMTTRDAAAVVSPSDSDDDEADE